VNYKKHLILGMLLFVLYLIYLGRPSLEEGILGFFVCFIGSLLPDTDTKKSRIHQTVVLFIGMFLFTGFFLTLYGYVGFLYSMLISAIISLSSVLVFLYVLPEHRKGLHTIRAAFVFSVFIWFCTYLIFRDMNVPLALAILAFMNYFGHLALDGSLKL
jgi:membrane-bound metal-dependent hydrolase YbcI (DUF457 family)